MRASQPSGEPARPRNGCLGRGLPDHLLVDPTHDDLRRHRHLELDARPWLDPHWMRETGKDLERGAAEGSAVPNPLEFEPPLVPVRHAFDHVRDERARETVQRAIGAPVRRTGYVQLLTGALDRHPRRDLLVQLPLRTGDAHTTCVDLDRDSARNLDGLPADTAHELYLPDSVLGECVVMV
jgi:hypothetical protein